MKHFTRKLKLILWKNCIIRKRRWLATLIEILLPILIFVIFAWVKSALPAFQPTFINETIHYPVTDKVGAFDNLYFVPNNANGMKIMEKVKDKSNICSGCEFRGFKTETEMLNHVTKLNGTHKSICVVFNNIFGVNLPKKLDYRIRPEYSHSFKVLNLYSEQKPFEAHEYYYYMTSNFLHLQEAIDTVFINLNKPDFDFTITTQLMPDPPHYGSNQLSLLFKEPLPIFTLIAFMILFINSISRILEEKASGIKELMKMMGLQSWMIWLGWFIHLMIPGIISVTVVTLIMKYSLVFLKNPSPLIESGSGFILWIFLFLYCVSGTFFAFLMSAIFKKPIYGSSIGGLLWFATILIPNLIEGHQSFSSLKFLRVISLLLPNCCLSYGFYTIYEFEEIETGIQWNNLFTVPQMVKSSSTMGTVLIMLLVDSMILLLLTWYLDNVFPGDYGVGKHFAFPFQKSYWSPRIAQSPQSHDQDKLDSRDEVEAVASNIQTGISIRNLTKIFNAKAAVDGLSLDIYHNELTVLLGHNGAGKTTTMNIITGMIPPTSGIILIGGYNTAFNMDIVRESLGLCPQHNVQFPDLTVLEHLVFFAMLKGMTKVAAKQESLKYISKLYMKPKTDNQAKTLSGGMRRRLSLGMALVGNTKVLMLDEPTSGMDPEARREIWDLLLSMRGERTILITTHYMEEADILGDRIAIMHSGHLECYGTPLYLKKHYGTGYVLSVLLAPGADLNAITKAIKTHVAEANVKNSESSSVKFDLPTTDTSALSKLFEYLENYKTKLKITSFGVSITTMDDVFLKVGKLADEHSKEQAHSPADSRSLLLGSGQTSDFEKTYNTGFDFCRQQVCALAKKRILFNKSKCILFLITLLLPILMVLVCVVSVENAESALDETKISLSLYENTVTYYSFDKENKELADVYAKFAKSQSSKAVATNDVSKAIVGLAANNPHEYVSMLVASAEFKSSKRIVNALFGKFPIHGPAVSLNLLTNALLKQAMGDEYSITVTNNPLPKQGSDTSISSVAPNWLTWLTNFPIGLAVSFALLINLPLAERISTVKHIQIMSGVSRTLYWLTTYLFDMLVYTVIIFMTVIFILIFGGYLAQSSVLMPFMLVLFLFGLAGFPFMYFLHYRPALGSVFTYTFMLQAFFGPFMTMSIMIWEMIPDDEIQKIRLPITYSLMVLPQFTFSYGLVKVLQQGGNVYSWEHMDDKQKNHTCAWQPVACCVPDSKECKDFLSYFAGNDSIYTVVLVLIAESILFFAFFLFVDYGYLRKCLDYCCMTLIRRFVRHRTTEGELDSDVIKEKRRVTAQIGHAQRMSVPPMIEDSILVSNLHKWFGTFEAVKGLNFGVKEGECFGLLGINGAGKTTTFKMLTGEIFPTAGTAKILQYSLKKNKNAYMKQIGYCPQFDAFNFELTTREMLELFANLRGIKQDQIKREVDKWLNRFDIMKYHKVVCANLSGGNKRKLSTAIALIGDPPVVMLDEPTSGVDPVARRNLWNILGTMRKSGQTIVLTSHSMDECEALCSRLAIMVDGQLKCIGDISYLKNKFGQGFTVMVKLRQITNMEEINFEKEVKNLKSIIENKYACSLKDEHKGMVLYHLTDPEAKLSEIFPFLEGIKNATPIVEDFTVCDTSLEEVFLSFARQKELTKRKLTKRNTVI